MIQQEQPVPAPRRPLRAVDPKELRQTWSRGQTYGEYAPRVSLADTPVEDMTLEQLRKTQWSEPPTESRRAFSQTGVGALSLDQLSTDRNARRFGTPYVAVDPQVAALIEWEQRVSQSSALVRFTLRDGQLQADRWVPRPLFLKLRRLANDYGLGHGTNWRTYLTRDAFAEAARRSREALRDAEYRHRAAAEPIDHSAYEVTHRGEIVATVTGPRRRDTWHSRAIDQGEVELGTDLIADDELEALLGADAFNG